MPDINPTRLLRDLRDLAEIGKYKTGVHRPALSQEHVASLHWFQKRASDAGLETTIDGIGNVFALSRAKGPKVLTGSHLESQNYAGWLDGPLGVIYGLEAARAIAEDPDLKDVGVDVAAWCDEEGHFGNFLGSLSAIGKIDEASLDAARDRTRGTSMREALTQAGLAGRPRIQVDPKRTIGYLEAHIEQGDWLEANKLKIGVVTSIVGIWQYRITFEGVQNHAGTTRMAIRKDAGLSAARLAVAIAEACPAVAGPRTVWTVGNIAFDPGAPSIIPGRAEMLFQIRDADPAVLKRMGAKLDELVAQANAKGPCTITPNLFRTSTPAVMADAFQSALETAAETYAPGLHTRIPSGAGHDAQILSQVMPAGMVFVPSIGGISHHWTENTADEDIVLGAQVFTSAIADLLKRARAA
jgi:N-carbamoyl-L-amino-acid hydrolase